jgi:hypothetical protein
MLGGKQENNMPRDLEGEDQAREAVNELFGELPAKLPQGLLEDVMDGWKRGDARETAGAQDAERRHVNSTRYDVNSYGGGATSIPDVCLIKKRPR